MMIIHIITERTLLLLQLTQKRIILYIESAGIRRLINFYIAYTDDYYANLTRITSDSSIKFQSRAIDRNDRSS